MTPSPGPHRGRRALSALGIVGAVALAVNANLLAARFYERWDLTRERLYTLSEPTLRILRSLSEPVDVILLLGQSDPLEPSLRHLLAAYGAVTDRLRVRRVDPEQRPAEFSAIQKKYGIVASERADGQPVTDASLVIARGERHWFVTSDRLVRVDPHGHRVQPTLEQALTEGIAQVVTSGETRVCFSRGHQEQSPYDAGPDGLAELRARLEKSNFVVEERDLGGAAPAGLAGCRVLVMGGPRLPFSPAAAGAVLAAARDGTSVLALLPPILSASGQVTSSGLESLATLAGVELGNRVVLETEPSRRAPRGIGEVFFAEPLPHVSTAGLVRDSEVVFDVLVSEARPVRPTSAAPLLRTTDQAVALDDLGPVLERRDASAIDAAPRARFFLASAHELEPAKDRPPSRLVLIGSVTPANNQSFRDPALYGGRLLVENAVSWLGERPALVSVPEKNPHDLGLALSEESLGEVLRYVLVYMPGTAALLGIFVLVRRRSLETRSRRKPRNAREEGDAPRS